LCTHAVPDKGVKSLLAGGTVLPIYYTFKLFLCDVAIYLVIVSQTGSKPVLSFKNRTQEEGGKIMGDKGGRKDREKQNKQADKAKKSKNAASKNKQAKAR